MSIKEKLKYLDPYTYLDIFLLKYFGKPKKIEIKIIYWVFYLLFSLFLAFIIYNLLGYILGTGLPLATVVSESMEPSFYRGDIVIIKNAKNINAETITINENIENRNLEEFAKIKYSLNKYNNKEAEKITINNQTVDISKAIENKNSVVVYKSNLNGRDIIHRVILIIKANDGEFVITKGDNGETNFTIDQECVIVNNYVVNGCIHAFAIKKENLLGKKIGRIPYIGYLKLFLFKG